ncbi:MAG: HNH endonuclease family protein [Bifidobacterium sp.]|nr:HNH endonuclease family protein [Bifidobacterium sp.]MCH4174973.1 HNH endonuclease family protein [Bifidobacterium sp.]
MTRRSNRRYSPVSFRASSPMERILILVVIAIVVGVTIGVLLPTFNDNVDSVTGGYTATGDAAQTLETLSVKNDDYRTTGYNRELFGYRSTDTDGNGCDIREDILARDLKEIRYSSSKPCQVRSGVLNDPYTGKTIYFLRGVQTSRDVQIDHVVALENAWRAGASTWQRTQRYAFGNDPYNLLAVDGDANSEKGSSSAAYWLPEQRSYRCNYVARQIGVKAKYSLSVTTVEKKAMIAVLHSCPGQAVPKQ